MRKVLEIGGLVAGAVLIVFGVAAIVMGANGRSTVGNELKQQQIVGTPDMTPAAIRAEAQKAGLQNVSFPTKSVAGKAITNGTLAREFAGYMRIHALEATGGYVYSQMGMYVAKQGTPKSELMPGGGTSNAEFAQIDPKTSQPVSNGARNVWVTETALTTALNASYMATQMALFGIVVGVALLLSGIGFVILSNVFGLLFALALNRTLKTRYLLRTLVFMPVVLSPVAVSFIWKFIFDYNGPLNQILGAIGLKSLETAWLASPSLAIVCILVVLVWQSIGFVMVTYLAGLATVPPELEEAAALDGAGIWRRFRSVTVPMIQPSIAIATTLTLIQGLRVFDQVMALTGGGPSHATETLATEIYNQTFTYQQFGFGAAMALLLSVLILIFTVVQQSITRDRTQMGS